ncbi:MAG: hypothetical protein V4510_05455 [bacterium]
MKTTTKMLVLAASMVMMATVLTPTASAFEIAGQHLGADNPCDGIIDDHCTCGYGVSYCQQGNPCREYVFGVCVQG